MKYIYLAFFILYSNLTLAAEVLAIVDGKAITSVDVNKRIEALKIGNPELIPNDTARHHLLENLISEELFHNEAKRLKISVSEEEIKQHFEDLEKIYRFPSSLTAKLIKNQSFYRQVESQVLWNKLVGMVLYSKIKVSDAEVRDEQKVRKSEIREVNFKQIIFNNSDNIKIEKLRTEAQNCQDLELLTKEKGLTSYNNSLLFSELNPDLQAIVKTLPENKLSEVINFQNQKQAIMICKKNIINDSQDVQRIKQELSNRKLNAEAQKYLAELRKRVYIEYMHK